MTKILQLFAQFEYLLYLCTRFLISRLISPFVPDYKEVTNGMQKGHAARCAPSLSDRA